MWQHEWPFSPRPGFLCCFIIAIIISILSILGMFWSKNHPLIELQIENCSNDYYFHQLCVECVGMLNMHPDFPKF